MSAHITIAETALIGAGVALAAAALTYFASRKSAKETAEATRTAAKEAAEATRRISTETIEAQRELTFAEHMWLKRFDSYSDLGKILTGLKSEALSAPIEDVESRFNEYRDRLAIVKIVASTHVYTPCKDFAEAISNILGSRRDSRPAGISAEELTFLSDEAFARMSDHLRKPRGDLKYHKPPDQENSQESN